MSDITSRTWWKKIPDHFKIAEMGRLKPEEIKWIVGRFRIAIGMRLHFQIFSHDQDTALIGIPYASKCRNFLKKYTLLQGMLAG